MCCAGQLDSVLVRFFSWQKELYVHLRSAWFCLGELGTLVPDHSAVPQLALAFWLSLQLGKAKGRKGLSLLWQAGFRVVPGCFSGLHAGLASSWVPKEPPYSCCLPLPSSFHPSLLVQPSSSAAPATPLVLSCE